MAHIQASDAADIGMKEAGTVSLKQVLVQKLYYW
jgi:hypothetical protein